MNRRGRSRHSAIYARVSGSTALRGAALIAPTVVDYSLEYSIPRGVVLSESIAVTGTGPFSIVGVSGSIAPGTTLGISGSNIVLGGTPT